MKSLRFLPLLSSFVALTFFTGFTASAGGVTGDDSVSGKSVLIAGAIPQASAFEIVSGAPGKMHDGRNFLIQVDALQAGYSTLEVVDSHGAILRHVPVTLDKGLNTI